jgi:hypothetical protein
LRALLLVRGLLGTLLFLLRLLGALLLVRRLLGVLLLLPAGVLLTLWLLGLLGALLGLLSLLPFRLVLLLVPLVVLCISRSNAPESQNQCGHEGNGFHFDKPRYNVLIRARKLPQLGRLREDQPNSVCMGSGN